jgi:hypothetical protein
MSRTSAAAETAPSTPAVRARSWSAAALDHDSVAKPPVWISTVARTRFLRFPATDHGSAIHAEETLTCADRVRSPRRGALDHDSAALESEVSEQAAKRIRSSRSRALDHDSKVLREADAAGSRSTGSDCFPDHVPTAQLLRTPLPTRKCSLRFGNSSMQIRPKCKKFFFVVQTNYLYHYLALRLVREGMYTK